MNFKGKIILITAVAALYACGSLPLSSIIKEPLISLNSTELTGIDFTGIDMLCKVNVENPNPVEIPFPKIDWNLFLSSNELVSGNIENGESLKAKKSTVVNVPFHIDYADLYNTVTSIRDAAQNGEKETDYKVALAAKFNLPVLGEKTLPLEINGKVPLLRMLKFSDISIGIDKIDFSGVSLNCLLNVENPNVFPIPFPKMDWDYSINKNSFIKSSVPNSAPLAADAVSPVTIKLTLAYADIYKNFQSLLNAGEASGALSLTSALGVPAFADEKQSFEGLNKIPLLKPPSIAFKGITVKNVNVFEGLLSGKSKIDFDIGFEIENKNNFSLSLDSLDYKLAVNGTRWAEGAAPKKTIAPNQKISVPLNLSVNNLSLVKEIAAMVAGRKSNIPYVCEGGITVAGDFPGLKPVNLPFNISGLIKF
jgi:LEA14-like dessication related protein